MEKIHENGFIKFPYGDDAFEYLATATKYIVLSSKTFANRYIRHSMTQTTLKCHKFNILPFLLRRKTI
mgnify:CR=1 FL=1